MFCLGKSLFSNKIYKCYFLSSASEHGAEVLHGPGQRHGELLPDVGPGDVPRVPRLDEHLAVVVTIGQREEVGRSCLLPPKQRRKRHKVVLFNWFCRAAIASTSNETA